MDTGKETAEHMHNSTRSSKSTASTRSRQAAHTTGISNIIKLRRRTPRQTPTNSSSNTPGNSTSISRLHTRQTPKP